MQRPTKTKYWIDILAGISARGTCPRRKCGAIIVDAENLILASGYNGAARGLDNCIDVPCPGVNDSPGNTDRCEALHAEQNAIMQLGDRMFRAVTLYCTNLPCFSCAKMICNTHIQHVVYMDDYADKRGLGLIKKKGINIFQYFEDVE
jgi:dCMP deaminase